MDKSVRNKIRIMVQDLRQTLQREVKEILEGIFGIHIDGTFESIDALPSLKQNPENLVARHGFEYFVENEVGRGTTKADAVSKLVLEIVFTHLNRFVGLKLLETRKVIRQTISRMHSSNGFKFYLADYPEQEKLWSSGQVDLAYKNFLIYQFNVVSMEVKVLFDTDDLSMNVFPRPKAIKEIIDIINDKDVEEIWGEDETIGWVYQYFTPKELKDQARAESGVPRNSAELAFRNQFYTPRYVVEYLTDNTLGRIWYEMVRGETKLNEYCKYLIHPESVCVEQGQEYNSFDSEYIREKKDPREIKVLDPACGSGHFLLYAFELLERIYLEAYYDVELGPRLQQEFLTIEEFRLNIPKLILENNLFGIDIDIRAIQIAALALWLRAQKHWNEMGIKRDFRPTITKVNLVCAEPMPGNRHMVEEFARKLQPTVLGDLLIDVWHKMKLAGELGSLIKIDDEINKSIKDAKQKYEEFNQTTMFSEDNSISDIKDSDIPNNDFWLRAEKMVFEALSDYSSKAVGGNPDYRRTIFAKESIQGLRFVEIMLNKYDVVLMNPPFGESSPKTKDILQRWYPSWNKNLLCAFIQRMLELTSNNGTVGVIFDRTAIVKSTYEDFRRDVLIDSNSMFSLADTGWEVLEANVETTTLVLNKSITKFNGFKTIFFDLRQYDEVAKSHQLLEMISKYNNNDYVNAYLVSSKTFNKMPNAVIGYDIPKFVQRLFLDLPNMLDESIKFKACVGHQVKTEIYIRYYWEIEQRNIGLFEGGWSLYYNGGEYNEFFSPIVQVINWGLDGRHLSNHPTTVLRNKDLQFNVCVGYGKRGEFLDAHLIRDKHFFSVEGLFISSGSMYSIWFMLGLLNSNLANYVINLYCGQHKHAGYLNLLPIANYKNSHLTHKIIDLAKEAYKIKHDSYAGHEVNFEFTKPHLLRYSEDLPGNINTINEQMDKLEENYENIRHNLNELIYELYAVDNKEDIDVITKYTARKPNDTIFKHIVGCSDAQKAEYYVQSLLSFMVGVFFGRWDWINGGILDNKHFTPDMQYVRDLTDMISCAEAESWEQQKFNSEPVKFLLTDELIMSAPLVEYPFKIDDDGIIPVDEGHPEDIVAKIEYAIGIAFGRELAAKTIEEIEKILGVTLRQYFSKQFFGWHVEQYLKRPIYWLLQSPQKSFSVYVYYHKLTKDTLFKIVRNYLEPKLNIVEEKLRNLESRLKVSNEREKRVIQSEKDNIEDELVDLQDFKSRLLKLAEIGYDPSKDDGISVNIAPFKDVIPWKDINKIWTQLESGDLDWSKMAFKLWPERIIMKTKKDKGLASVHKVYIKGGQ